MKDIAEPPIPAAEITKVTGPVLIFPPHTRISSRSQQAHPTWSNPLSDRYNPSPHPSLASCNATMLAINKCNAMQPQDPPPGLTRHRARWTLGRALCERYRPLWTCAQHTRVAMRWWAGLFPGFGRLGVRAFCTFWALAPYACLWRISRLNVRDCRIDGIGGCV